MSSSNHTVTLRSPKAGYEEDFCLSSKQDSEPLTYLSILPEEILKIIAEYITKKEDLNHFSEVSAKARRAALRIINLQNENLVIKALKVLGNLSPRKHNKPSSAFDLYQDFLATISDLEFNLIFEGASIDDNKLEELQQSLTALSTTQAVERSGILKKACYQQIMKGETSHASIEEKYSELKCAFVIEAVKLVIFSSLNTESSRGAAVYRAANSGHLSIVQALLSDGEISKYARGWAVRSAARRGRLDIVRFLLENEDSIDQFNRGLAVRCSASNGHLEIVQFLLANGSEISELDRGFAVGNAARCGHLNIVQFLLENEISKNARGWAVIDAASGGYLEIVQVLLADGAVIYDKARKEAIEYALRGNYHSVANYLKQKKKWSCRII